MRAEASEAAVDALTQNVVQLNRQLNEDNFYNFARTVELKKSLMNILDSQYRLRNPTGAQNRFYVNTVNNEGINISYTTQSNNVSDINIMILPKGEKLEYEPMSSRYTKLVNIIFDFNEDKNSNLDPNNNPNHFIEPNFIKKLVRNAIVPYIRLVPNQPPGGNFGQVQGPISSEQIPNINGAQPLFPDGISDFLNHTANIGRIDFNSGSPFEDNRPTNLENPNEVPFIQQTPQAHTPYNSNRYQRPVENLIKIITALLYTDIYIRINNLRTHHMNNIGIQKIKLVRVVTDENMDGNLQNQNPNFNNQFTHGINVHPYLTPFRSVVMNSKNVNIVRTVFRTSDILHSMGGNYNKKKYTERILGGAYDRNDDFRYLDDNLKPFYDNHLQENDNDYDESLSYLSKLSDTINYKPEQVNNNIEIEFLLDEDKDFENIKKKQNKDLEVFKFNTTEDEYRNLSLMREKSHNFSETLKDFNLDKTTSEKVIEENNNLLKYYLANNLIKVGYNDKHESNVIEVLLPEYENATFKFSGNIIGLSDNGKTYTSQKINIQIKPKAKTVKDVLKVSTEEFPDIITELSREYILAKARTPNPYNKFTPPVLEKEYAKENEKARKEAKIAYNKRLKQRLSKIPGIGHAEEKEDYNTLRIAVNDNVEEKFPKVPSKKPSTPSNSDNEDDLSLPITPSKRKVTTIFGTPPRKKPSPSLSDEEGKLISIYGTPLRNEQTQKLILKRKRKIREQIIIVLHHYLHNDYKNHFDKLQQDITNKEKELKDLNEDISKDRLKGRDPEDIRNIRVEINKLQKQIDLLKTKFELKRKIASKLTALANKYTDLIKKPTSNEF